MNMFDIIALIAGVLLAFVVYEYVTNKAMHAKIDTLLGRGAGTAAPAAVDHVGILNAAANVVKAAVLNAPPAAPVFDPSMQIQTPWGVKNFKDFPTYKDFAQLEILAGGNVSDDQIKAWMAATGNGDQHTHTAGGAAIQALGTPASENGTDFGSVPSGRPLSNWFTAGEKKTFTFHVAQPGTKMRLLVASEKSMGKPIFDNFSLVMRLGAQVVKQLTQPANSGESFVTFEPFAQGDYTMDFIPDKADQVVLQFLPTA